MLTRAIEIIEMFLMQQTVILMMPPNNLHMDKAHERLFANPIVQDALDYLLDLRASGHKIKISMATADWLTDYEKWKDVG